MREYANKIVEELKGLGLDAEVKDVPKTNGIVLTGIVIKVPNSNVGITLYAENFKENNLPVERAVTEIQKIYEAHIAEGMEYSGMVNDIKEYANIKDKLTLKLYNKTTEAEVFRSAKRYGFEDLILVPAVNLECNGSSGIVKVTEKIIDIWGVDKNTLFADAMNNTKKQALSLKSLYSFVKERCMFDEELPFDDNGPVIVTTEDEHLGAVAIIPALKQFKKKFPDGFYVIPSSIHEVLVFPKGTMPREAIDDMIKLVNQSEVAPEEVLADHVYEF